MPLVEITIVEGREPDRIRALIHEVHTAVVHALAVPEPSVRVAVRTVPRTHWAAGDVTVAEREAAESGAGS